MNNAVVIVPTYNERETIAAVTEKIFAAVPEIDILFVDDNSPDGTGALADTLAATDKRVKVLHREQKQGLGRAYIAGFKWALERHYEFIFEMDADLSHNPADLPNFLAAAEKADLVLGSRYIGGIRVINWPLSRLILSKGASYYVRIITGLPFSDPTGGYKCFRRRVLESIPLDNISSSGYSFQIEMTHLAWLQGFRIAEVPIVFEERRSGASKMSKNIIWEALWMVWKIFIRNGCRRSPRQIQNPAMQKVN